MRAPGDTIYRRAQSEKQRVAPGATTYREVGSGAYRLTLPTTMEGGGVHHVAEEERDIEVWRGTVCEDALADVFVNSAPLARRSWRELEESARYWLTPDTRAWIDVPGAKKAMRLDGTTFRYGPAEPDRTTIVIARAGDEVVTLTIHGTERADVQAEMERVVTSFRIVERGD